MALAYSSVLFILRLLLFCSLQPGQPLIHLHQNNNTSTEVFHLQISTMVSMEAVHTKP